MDQARLKRLIMAAQVSGTPMRGSGLGVRAGGVRRRRRVGGVGVRAGGVRRRRVGGDAANKAASKRSPWLKFLRQFRKEHPHLPQNQLVEMASPIYRQLHGLSAKTKSRAKLYKPKARGMGIRAGVLMGGSKRRAMPRRGGDAANMAAAARNPWLAFLRKFRKQHPHLPQNELVKMASPLYHQMQGSGYRRRRY